jgi:hypothetical protein
MNEIIFLMGDDPEGGYVAQAIGQSILTQCNCHAQCKAQLQHNQKPISTLAPC